MTIIIEDISVSKKTRYKLESMTREFASRCLVQDGVHALFILDGYLVFFSDFVIGRMPFREWQRWKNPEYVLENEMSLTMAFQLYLGGVEKQINLHRDLQH